MCEMKAYITNLGKYNEGYLVVNGLIFQSMKMILKRNSKTLE